MASDLFYQELERELKNLTRDTRIYKLLRQYLLPLGLWKGRKSKTDAGE